MAHEPGYHYVILRQDRKRTLTHKPRNPPVGDRIGGGGAATSAGMRFEQQLGALFSSWILAGDRFADDFRLGAAVPEWIRFETEAPIDDILIKTNVGGYVAVQAKTAVSLSEDLSSPLGKTIAQFVRHWVVAHQGDGSMEWNRPLDAVRDRMVLAVSPRASVQVREDLPAALLLVSQPGRGVLNQAQKRAFEVFSSLVGRAWASVTKSPFDDKLPSELAKLVVVFTFDSDQGYALASGSIVRSFGLDIDAAAAFTVLSDLSGRLMRERGGGDLSIWRKLLASRGVVLAAPPEYRDDIEVLKRHSKRIADVLGSYEKIEVASGAPLSVRRDCQIEVETAVRNGPLLIIGEPGAGKSGVLNALGRKLCEDGSDVLQLAVDRYSIESLEGLTRELGLKHPLLDVLEAWDGPGPAYLVVDALDATRGGRGEGVFRALIERVLERKGRWNVVASIRNFDLRMGRQFRVLFQGAPPVASLADPSFADVRHVLVPPWSETEFDQLLQQSPALATCIARATPRLRDLAMVPFNTRLLSELVSGEVAKDLDLVASQADLLRLYWDYRVEAHGLPARSCINRVVQLMVQARALRAPALEAAGDDPATIDLLCQEGVLVFVDSGRWVQFRHHLIFDYAAARVTLDPSDIISGIYRFTKSEALGMMLSPALGFVLRETWESETNHARFWIALSTLINDEDGDPIIRSAASRFGAEFPVAPQDCLWLGDLAIAGDKKASKTLSHVTSALVVRLEDEKKFAVEPWVCLGVRLATAPTTVADNLRLLLHILMGWTKDGAFRPMLGEAARALLAHGLAQPEPGFIVRSAIDFVIATYDTDVEAARALLVQLLGRDRLDRFGHEEVPAVCYKIEAVGNVDPEFVAEIYRIVFGYEVTEDRQTRISQSQILSLTSSAQQDYGMARWSLGEYLPKFLQIHPVAAVRAVVNAVEGYIAREHPLPDGALDTELRVGEWSIHLREDRSYIWAHDPSDDYGQDAESLVSKLREHLKVVSEAEALELVESLIDKASFAIFWSRMFLCAVERDDSIIGKLWPIAATEDFLVLPDTRKDAIDLVAIGFGRRPVQEREAFERAALRFDFARFKYQGEARKAFLERIFSQIGRENLVLDEARQILDAKSGGEMVTNDRLFAVRTAFGVVEDFHWIGDLDKEAPENLPVIRAINVAKMLLQLEAKSEDVTVASLGESLAALQGVRTSLVENAPHAELRGYAEAIIGQGCGVVVSRQLLVSHSSPPTQEQDASFVDLLGVAGRSDSPEPDSETEARFDESASWGAPAARVEAAHAYWDLLAQRADLYHVLMPRAELLLSDRHPAVRLNASVRLYRIWDLDRDRFWQLLTDRFASEPNLTVIEHLLGEVVSRLIHADQQRSLDLLLALLQREAPGSDRRHRLSKAVADKLAVLWVIYQSVEAKAVLDQWLDAPWEHAEEAAIILRTLRDVIVAGLSDTPDRSESLRRRAQALVSDIVNATNARLARYMARSDLDEAETAEARECARLIDIAGMQMYFSINARASHWGNGGARSYAGLDIFLRENAVLLRNIAEYAAAHTTYYLLQLIEHLIEVDAVTAFDLLVSTLQAGRRSGYQNESLGVDILVRLIGVFLADHREIFEDSDRRADLVDCLEIFLEAGWPAARRLLYRLPELIQ